MEFILSFKTSKITLVLLHLHTLFVNINSETLCVYEELLSLQLLILKNRSRFFMWTVAEVVEIDKNCYNFQTLLKSENLQNWHFGGGHDSCKIKNFMMYSDLIPRHVASCRPFLKRGKTTHPTPTIIFILFEPNK